MFVIKASKDGAHPFTQISKSLINDNRLSLKSKALLLFLISKPDTWCFNFPDILRSCKDGIKSIRSSIRELISTGYISISQSHRPNGDFHYFNYTVFETPLKLSSTKSTTPARTPFGHALKGHTLKGHTLKGHTPNNKNKIILRKETATSSTMVVNTTAAVVSPAFSEKRKECIRLCDSLKILSPDSLILKYSLDLVFKHAQDFKTKISKASDPTAFLVASIINKWIPKPVIIERPPIIVISGFCIKCKKQFYYEDYKPTRKICGSCEK